MGSRAVAVVVRDPSVATKRFGVETESWGVITTRTGRPFFDSASDHELLARLAKAAEPLFDQLDSDWLLLDCELMPWSAKASELIRGQYAAVGSAARAAAAFQERVVAGLSERNIGLSDSWSQSLALKAESARRFVDAYRRYCWSVNSIEDYKLAPFHLLASEGHVHTDKDHVWHMETLAQACNRDTGVLLATPYRVINLSSEDDRLAACSWWEELVASGGEGMVVKPRTFLTKNSGRAVQPAIKCRGPEYLRLIYGPEYLLPSNLERLRKRSLNRKRMLALKEFALGIEAMRRFVAREPLRRVHECVFGVLALESEPVDPRL